MRGKNPREQDQGIILPPPFFLKMFISEENAFRPYLLFTPALTSPSAGVFNISVSKRATRVASPLQTLPLETCTHDDDAAERA